MFQLWALRSYCANLPESSGVLNPKLETIDYGETFTRWNKLSSAPYKGSKGRGRKENLNAQGLAAVMVQHTQILAPKMGHKVIDKAMSPHNNHMVRHRLTRAFHMLLSHSRTAL